MKRNNITIIVLLALSLLVFSGCADTGPKLQTFEVSDIEDSALAGAKARVLSNQETLKAVMDRDYADGLSDEALEETRLRITREYEQRAEEELEKQWGGAFIAHSDVVFYRDTLKRVQEENLSIDDLFITGSEKGFRVEEDAIKSGSLLLIGVTDVSGKKQEDTLIQSISQLAGPFRANFFVFPKTVLNTYTKEQIRDFSNPLMELRKVSDYTFSDSIWFEGLEAVKKSREKIEEKYRIPFEIVFQGASGKLVASPLNDLKTIFEIESDGETPTSSDLYLTVLAQQKMSTFVNQQIVAVGLDGTMVQYTRVNNRNAFSPFSEMPYDMSGGINDRKFLKEIYGDDFDTLLIYLLAPGEKPEYKVIQSLVNGIKTMIDDPYNHRVDVCFYHVKAEQKKVIKNLFLTDYAPDYYVNDDFAQSMAAITIIRGDTEGFDYLDVYCEQDPLYGELLNTADPSLSLTQFEALFKER